MDPPPRKLRRAGRSEDTILRIHLRCMAATVDRRASSYAQRAPVDPPPRKLRRAGRSEDTILRSPESTPEVPVSEGVSGARLEVSLESLCQLLRLKCDIQLQFPGSVLGGILAFARVVIRQPLPNVTGAAPVESARIAEAFNNVSVVHFLHCPPCTEESPPTRFALRRAPSFARLLPLGMACHP